MSRGGQTISKIHITITNNNSEIAIRSELFQNDSYGIRGSSKHKQEKPGRIVQRTIHHHVNMGMRYITDMTFNANIIYINQVQNVSDADVDRSESIIDSYTFHRLSYDCAFQEVIQPSEVDARVLRQLNDLQHPNLYFTKFL